MCASYNLKKKKKEECIKQSCHPPARNALVAPHITRGKSGVLTESHKALPFPGSLCFGPSSLLATESRTYSYRPSILPAPHPRELLLNRGGQKCPPGHSHSLPPLVLFFLQSTYPCLTSHYVTGLFIALGTFSCLGMGRLS